MDWADPDWLFLGCSREDDATEASWAAGGVDAGGVAETEGALAAADSVAAAGASQSAPARSPRVRTTTIAARTAPPRRS